MSDLEKDKGQSVAFQQHESSGAQRPSVVFAQEEVSVAFAHRRKESVQENPQHIEALPAVGSEKFRFKLCGCLSDVELCLDIICCPCCHISRQCSSLEGKPHEWRGIWCCVGCLCCVPSVIRLRLLIAHQFQIRESQLAGCCAAMCCPCCSLCQTSRELSFQGRPTGNVCCPRSIPIEQQMI